MGIAAWGGPGGGFWGFFPPFPSPDLGGRTPKSITLSGVSGRLNPGALGVNEASFPDGLIKTVLINPVGF